MLPYIDAVLISHMVKGRAKLDLPANSYGLCICNLSGAYRCDSVVKKPEDNSINVSFIPTGCTGQLQPLRVAVKNPSKCTSSSYMYSVSSVRTK